MYKKNVLKPLGFSFILLSSLFITSCKKVDLNFGEEFVNNDLTSVVKVDTFSASLSTVYLDSFQTNGRGNIMLGGYTDPIFGKITTQSYFEIVPSGVWADLYQKSFFDSITLILKPNGNFYGDTSLPLNVIVKELQDSIVYPENNRFAFYNHQTFKTKAGVLGSFTGKIAPKSGQPITIRLNDALGIALLNELKNVNNTIYKSNANFLNYFKGIQLSSTSNNEVAINTGDDVIVRLHYKQTSVTPLIDKKFDFSLSTRTKQFNNISVDRTGTVLQNIKTLREIPSSATNNAAYAQSTTNTAIKLSFPSLSSVVKQPNFAKVLKAALIIKPLKGTYFRNLYLPPTLRLSETDANNKVGKDLAFLGSNGGLVSQLGLLKVDYDLNENTQYQYDLTEFVKSEIVRPSTAKGYGLLLSPPNGTFETNFARLVLGNNASSLGSIKVDIYYAAVK